MGGVFCTEIGLTTNGRTCNHLTYIRPKRKTTRGASRNGHVLDHSTGESNNLLLILGKRAIVQSSSPVEVSDTTRELIVTLLGLFILGDELGTFSFLVVYIWKDCVIFFLNLIKLSLNGR